MMSTVRTRQVILVVMTGAMLIALPGLSPVLFAQDSAKPPLAALAKPSAVNSEAPPKVVQPAVTQPQAPAVPRPWVVLTESAAVQPVSAPAPPRPAVSRPQPPQVSPPRVGGR